MRGLGRVSIGTSRSDREKDALVLDALTVVQAERLRDDLLHRHAVPTAAASTGTEGSVAAPPAGPPPAAPVATGAEIARFDPRWIRFGAFPLSGIVIALPLALVAVVVAGFGIWWYAGPLPAGCRPFRW